MSRQEKRGTGEACCETTHGIVPCNVTMHNINPVCANEPGKVKSAQNVRCISEWDLVNSEGIGANEVLESTSRPECEVEFVASIRECPAEIGDVQFASAYRIRGTYL